MHASIAQLSQRAHELAPVAYGGDKATRAELHRVEEEVNRGTASLRGLMEQELADVWASLKELKG